ncbi:hypothetical protein Nepgr_029113 [Nepenthes gracilis]|uniref:Beta-glucosidase n=1 Tax=Nepenthes gracilis TaxID=150966 RepID=A0AAD3Y4K1_NEPGR|nr:hypothetical protein Nepgr_029113 [Nepenthes gracilis]
MATKDGVVFCLLALATAVICNAGDVDPPPFSRRDFPKHFIFGAASSAYQIEGAAFTDGKEASIWDVYTERYPEKIMDGSNGLVAADFYHRYKDDVKLVKDMGVDAFRFSISWPRILPRGRISGGVNPLGIKFYNDLINELLANGITPFVTLFHWDLPNALEEEYCGFLSPLIVKDFRDYADLCFKEFGDRVKFWMTVNEPELVSSFGYDGGIFAPGRCSIYVGNCSAGDSGTEPYIVAHHKLLAHAATVEIYRKKYKATQNGVIGVSLASDWVMPIDHQPANRLAASRALDFTLGWILDPVMYGRYPKSMQAIVGDRLPQFSEKESHMLRNSVDYVGLQYYTTKFATDTGVSDSNELRYTTDMHADLSNYDQNGNPVGEPTPLSWLFIYPAGLRDLMLYIKERYNNPLIFITENGMADGNDKSISLEEALNDTQRIRYHEGHLSYILQAIEDGVNVRGYFPWTFIDTFEWVHGYTARFGLYFVDFEGDLKRYAKKSVSWFKTFLTMDNFPRDEL